MSSLAVKNIRSITNIKAVRAETGQPFLFETEHIVMDELGKEKEC